MRVHTLLVFLCSVAAACGGTASNVLSTGDGSTSTQVVSCAPGAGYAQLDDASDPVRAAIEKSQAVLLDHLVGRFVRGETPLFRGTLQAQDDASILGPGETDATIPSSEAFGAFESGSDGRTQLFIYDPSTSQYVQLAQHGTDATDVYMILPESSIGGRFGTCVGCAPAFVPAPSAIDVSDAEVTYQYEYAPAPMTISVTTHLSAVDPCSLTFADLAGADPRESAGFQPVGDEMVWHVSSIYLADPNALCTTATPFSIDLYVNSTQPWLFGVRNYVAGASYQACHNDPPTP